MADLFPIIIQLVVEDPAGRILLARGTDDDSPFEYLEDWLGYGQGLESSARGLVRLVTEALDYPTLEFFRHHNGSVASRHYVLFRIKLKRETVLPDPPEGISEWRWFEPDKIKDNKKVAWPVRHDFGDISGPYGEEYVVSGRRPQWPQPPKAA